MKRTPIDCKRAKRSVSLISQGMQDLQGEGNKAPLNKLSCRNFRRRTRKSCRHGSVISWSVKHTYDTALHGSSAPHCNKGLAQVRLERPPCCHAACLDLLVPLRVLTSALLIARAVLDDSGEVGVRLGGCAPAMLLPCYCHAIAMLLPCSCHALALQRSKGMIRRTSVCDPTVSKNTLHEVARVAKHWSDHSTSFSSLVSSSSLLKLTPICCKRIKRPVSTLIPFWAAMTFSANAGKESV
jgi:hypothetical protein